MFLNNLAQLAECPIFFSSKIVPPYCTVPPPPPILAAVNIFANPLIEGVYNKALAANNLHFLQQAMAGKKGVHPTAGISITV